MTEQQPDFPRLVYWRRGAGKPWIRRFVYAGIVAAVLALAAPAASDAALPLNCSGALPPGAACHVPGTSSTSLSLGAAERTVATYWNTPEAWFVERCGVAPSGWVGSTSTRSTSAKTVVAHAYVFNSTYRRAEHVWAESVFGTDTTVNWGGVTVEHVGACVGY